MATATIKDVSLVPADPAAPAGAQVTIVTYQVGTGALRVVMVPSATPTLPQVQAAIQSDWSFHGAFVGQTVAVTA